MTDNVEPFTKEPVSHYPVLGELADRLDDLINEYAGEMPTMAVIGILEAKKFMILTEGLED